MAPYPKFDKEPFIFAITSIAITFVAIHFVDSMPQPVSDSLVFSRVLSLVDARRSLRLVGEEVHVTAYKLKIEDETSDTSLDFESIPGIDTQYFRHRHKNLQDLHRIKSTPVRHILKSRKTQPLATMALHKRKDNKKYSVRFGWIDEPSALLAKVLPPSILKAFKDPTLHNFIIVLLFGAAYVFLKALVENAERHKGLEYPQRGRG